MDKMMSNNNENIDNIQKDEDISNNELTYIVDGQALVNNIIDIKYIGKLIDVNNQSKKIFLHYGYGLLWENADQIELIKGENSYYTSIKLANFDSISFCFRDELNNWDINESGSYNVVITKEDNSITKVENELPFVPDDVPVFDKIIENIKKFLWNFFKKLSKAKM